MTNANAQEMPESAAPALRVEVQDGDGKIIEGCLLDRSLLTIGRDSENDIVLNHLKVSGHHLDLIREGGSVLLIDKQSTNGVFLEGRRIRPDAAQEWQPGQTVRVADFTLRLREAHSASETVASSAVAASVKNSVPPSAVAAQVKNTGPSVAAAPAKSTVPRLRLQIEPPELRLTPAKKRPCR